MSSSIQFHSLHGEHIKLSKNNTVAKRVDSFCKGICFSHRIVAIREKIYVRLVNKSVQWTGFLRLGMTTCDPNTHRTSTALPRHACPDLTCRPGYWAKCVPENCFDVTNKLTYFYVDDRGELFLNTPNGEISLLTGIYIEEPLWALLDIYGNCISIELIDDPQPRSLSLNNQLRTINTTVTTTFFRDLHHDIRPVTFLPVHSSSISFFSPSSNSLPDKSIVLFDQTKHCDGLVFFSEPLTINTGVLIQILRVIASNESRRQTTTTAATSTSFSSHLQLGLTNCDIKSLLLTNDLPLNIEQINRRSEVWIIQDFQLTNKTTIDQGDEFLFVLNPTGIIEYSHNNSKFQEFIHLDANLSYYPFLIVKGDIVALRSMGFLKTLDTYRALQRPPILNPNQPKTSTEELLSSNDKKNNELQSALSPDCTVCFDRLRDTVLIPCGHVCVCYVCAKELYEQRKETCPICRSPITQINKIYLA